MSLNVCYVVFDKELLLPRWSHGRHGSSRAYRGKIIAIINNVLVSAAAICPVLKKKHFEWCFSCFPVDGNKKNWDLMFFRHSPAGSWLAISTDAVKSEPRNGGKAGMYAGTAGVTWDQTWMSIKLWNPESPAARMKCVVLHLFHLTVKATNLRLFFIRTFPEMVQKHILM